MTDIITIPKGNFPWKNLALLTPSTIHGKTFFSKIQSSQNDLIIQTPKCISKQGFVTSGKTKYIDLLFETHNEEFIEWMECLEERLQDLIMEKRERWFHQDIDRNDLENLFTPSLRTFKSGKYYCLRAHIGSPRMIQNEEVKIFDTFENVLSMEQITRENTVLSILQVHGIKFTSTNFQLYFECKQVMLMDESVRFKKPLFHLANSDSVQNEVHKNKKDNSSETPVQEIIEEEIEADLQHESSKAEPQIIVDHSETSMNETETNSDEREKNSHTERNDEGNTNQLEDDLHVEDSKLISFDTSNIISEELEKVESTEPDKHALSEVSLECNNNELIHLNTDDREKYRAMYLEAFERAKQARKDALKAYMELNHIKQNYPIESQEDEEFSESEWDSQNEDYDESSDEDTDEIPKETLNIETIV